MLGILFILKLLLRFIDDNFDPDHAAKIGVDIKVTTLTVIGNSSKLAIWVRFSCLSFQLAETS